MTTPPLCPCEGFVHPRVVNNPPGRAVVDYRIGDFASFRHALLAPRPNEAALLRWHPEARTDLALQLLEWWAYLADVLTFYNERAIQEVLLRTAVHPEDLRRIVRLLGYRPRPGIGATGVVAALADATVPFIIPRGFPIQGATPSGQPPQIFEVDDDIQVGLLGRPLPISARLPVTTGTSGTSPTAGYATLGDGGRLRNEVEANAPGEVTHVIEGQNARIGLDGVIASVKPDDRLLILSKTNFADHSHVRVLSVTPTWDKDGHAITTVEVRPGQSLPGPIDPAHHRILRSTKLAHLWLYHARFRQIPEQDLHDETVVDEVAQFAENLFDPFHLVSGGFSSTPPDDPRPLTKVKAHLEAIVRGLRAGDPVVFEQVGQPPVLVQVDAYSEQIWYANPPEGDRLTNGPPVGPPGHALITGGASPIPLPHTKIEFATNDAVGAMASNVKTVVVHYGWEQVGKIVKSPRTDPTTTVDVPASPDVPPDVPVPVLVEDVKGDGAAGFIGTVSGTDGVDLVPPLRALINLLPVSRGETVTGEILGSGDPILVRQEFALKKVPLTYLTDTGPRSVNGYRSTLRIRVAGIEWYEVPSFFEQPPDARVFATREDDEQRTHVRFGDGENGARLPAGTDNVVASYRHGSGAALPRRKSLTTILRPVTGLQAIRNPVPVGGGADPDPAEQLRRYAPRSVLTFGRAISGDDYETFAAQTPGVRRAQASWSWDDDSQRTLVKIFVGDDAAAVTAARDALRKFADPNRPVVVAPATPIYPHVYFTLEVDPAYEPAVVKAAVTAALLDPGRPPFGTDVVRIGAVVYDSHVYGACLEVPGVVAVHHLWFRIGWQFVPGPRRTPVPGTFFLLRETNLHIAAEAARHAL
jgi:hypothetical protein